MKKHYKFIAGIMAVSLAFCVGVITESITPIVSAAASAENNKNIYENLKYSFLDDGTIEITGCDKSVTEIVIPSEIDGVPVTSIGYSAFYDCEKLTSITIPDSVTSIGDYAFNHTDWLFEKRKENPLVIVNNILIDGRTCSGDVVIPDGVTSIGEEAFFNCESLTSIIIPESITSIGRMAFDICDNLTSITILNPDCEIYDSDRVFCNKYTVYEYTLGNYDFDGTIYGYENSTAQAYAKKYYRKFIALDKENTATGDINGDGNLMYLI